MKKLGLLAVGAFMLASCDSTPSGNKAILPVEHEGNMEVVDENQANENATDNASADTTLDATEIDVAEENAATKKLEEERTEEEVNVE